MDIREGGWVQMVEHGLADAVMPGLDFVLVAGSGAAHEVSRAQECQRGRILDSQPRGDPGVAQFQRVTGDHAYFKELP